MSILPRVDNVAGDAFYRGIRREPARFERKLCKRCGEEGWHLRFRDVCVTCREQRLGHWHGRRRCSRA